MTITSRNWQYFPLSIFIDSRIYECLERILDWVFSTERTREFYGIQTRTSVYDQLRNLEK